MLLADPEKAGFIRTDAAVVFDGNTGIPSVCAVDIKHAPERGIPRR